MDTANKPVYEELDGKTALVTGASKNIGRSIAVTLAEAGVDVGITAKSNINGCEKTASQVRENGSKAAIELGDLANSGEVAGVVERIREEIGPIDILVNNAAIRPHAPFEELTVEQWDRVQNTNLRSAFIMAQEVLSDMRRQGEGAIVHISGLIGHQGRKDSVATTVSKAGLFGLTRSLAADLGPAGIRVNNIIPGRKLKTDRDQKNQQHFEIIEDCTPLRRRADPEEVAKVVRFVVSSEATYINGEQIKVDGGLSNSQTGAHVVR